jgi:hypothetical protein
VCGSARIGIIWPDSDPHPEPADPDPDPYPLQPKVKLKYNFFPENFNICTVQNIENYYSHDANEKDKTM